MLSGKIGIYEILPFMGLLSKLYLSSEKIKYAIFSFMIFCITGPAALSKQLKSKTNIHTVYISFRLRLKKLEMTYVIGF